MKAVRLVVIGALLLCRVPGAAAQGDLPPAAQEVLKPFQQDVAELDRKFEEQIKKLREKVSAELKKLQDLYCKEAKLDEAVAVRDLIRSLQAGMQGEAGDLPAAAREIYKQYEEEVAAVQEKAEAEFKTRRDKASAELKKVQDQFCKDAKLDEAVAVRDLIKALQEGVPNALPDPGYVNNANQDIGKVFYYQVTGVKNQGVYIYGTDVYTTGSHLGMAAVHTGILKEGQKGIVKVTILPGQANYVATTRNGVTSYGYGAWGVSFKVERVYGFLGKLPVQAQP
jgi:hypothetical protein